MCVKLEPLTLANPKRSAAKDNMCFVSKCWTWKQALLLSAGIWLWCGVCMKEERSRVVASWSFMSLLHVFHIKALFYILWFLWGGEVQVKWVLGLFLMGCSWLTCQLLDVWSCNTKALITGKCLDWQGTWCWSMWCVDWKENKPVRPCR